ncbi:OmpH family outer membrane protein [Porphyrobacter algicida]|uniref:OmpH family outer membrane protein n=1 Tax=Qipengyuania algicida TaxID=1836209 RepID=A0A845AD57_9SPHN|nr:OmpH family outer membrane protein [Qipengyuania algicida]MXP27319.1 OmpH family outer membrane protein [Qipengyuania algicida]
MKLLPKTTALATVAVAAAAIAMPATAQVNGIATSSPEVAIAKSQARTTAYEQIGKTYDAQIKQIGQLRQKMAQDQKALDTNNDGQISNEEAKAKPSIVQQLQTTEQQAQTLSQPIAMAQTYALEQIIQQYAAARQQVISQKNIQIMLNPDAVEYGPPTIDVTDDIVAALNQRVPSVTTTPPANWRPSRQAAQLRDSVQNLLIAAAQQQAAQQAATPTTGSTSAKPTGR